MDTRNLWNQENDLEESFDKGDLEVQDIVELTGRDETPVLDKKRQTPLLDATEFVFPYLYRFAGQDKEERILYVAREAKVMLQLRQISLVTVAATVVLLAWWLGTWAEASFLNKALVVFILWLITGLTALSVVAVWAWLQLVWKKTVGIVTTYRLVKIVQVNPLNSVTQSLPLREVVDTSADAKGLWSALFKISSFTARSSATSSGVATDDAGQGKMRINRKYFYFDNINNATDLEHYINKLLNALQTHTPEEMKTFRPFIAEMKPEERDEFMRNYPEYWS